MRSNPASIQVDHKIAATQPHLQAPLLILILLPFPPHLQVTSSSKTLKPWKSPMRSRIINSFFQIPINVDDLTSSHEFIFLMTPRMVSPFRRVFSLFCWPPSEELLSMTSITSWNVFFKIIRLKVWNHSLIHGLQNGWCVSRHKNKMNLAVHLHQKSRVTGCTVSEQS